MLEIKTQNELKTLAEAADIATWPVEIFAIQDGSTAVLIKTE